MSNQGQDLPHCPAHDDNLPPVVYARSKTDASMERTMETLYSPDVSSTDKKRFVSKLRQDLSAISRVRRGSPTDEDVDKIISQLKALVKVDAKSRMG